MPDIPRGQGGDGSPQLDLDAIEAEHHSDGFGLSEPRFCFQCWWVWPCPTSQLVALVRRLQQENERLEEELTDAANVEISKDFLITTYRGRVEELTEALREKETP